MKYYVFKSIFLFILSLGISYKSFSQVTYRIYFTDKNGTEYNPYQYLQSKAIERRIINGLNLCDISDFPLNEFYFSSVNNLADSIKGVSRWMNAIFIYTSEKNIQLIKKFPFVKNIEAIYPDNKSKITCSIKESGFDTILTAKQNSLLISQLDRMDGKLLIENNLDGKGVRIAIIDVGFKSYETNPAFKHILAKNGIIATYDFVKKQTNVNIGMLHGSNVLSCIAGKSGNYQIGLATGAEFLLARTESYTEFFSEEENWLMAAEWADKNGADIINSSLGYTSPRYLPENMDGKTAFVSKAAQLAVDKGILVVSSAGNEGTGKWKRVAAPGDAAGVLTVGGIDPYTGIHSDFSSFGPSWDKRIKPEVCAYGTAMVSSRNGLVVSEGTSFSSPLVAGFAACLKQRYPLLKNSELKELICRSGDLWPYYDYAHGFGVPQPYFLLKDTIENKPTLSIIDDNDEITFYPIEWDTSLQKKGSKIDTTFPSIKDSVVNFNSSAPELIKNKWITKNSCKTTVPEYLFYHIKNNKGYIDKYYIIDLKDEENGSVSISKNITDKPFSIAFFYKGYYKEIIIKE